jgi:hypothetical protein
MHGQNTNSMYSSHIVSVFEKGMKLQNLNEISTIKYRN